MEEQAGRSRQAGREGRQQLEGKIDVWVRCIGQKINQAKNKRWQRYLFFLSPHRTACRPRACYLLHLYLFTSLRGGANGADRRALNTWNNAQDKRCSGSANRLQRQQVHRVSKRDGGANWIPLYGGSGLDIVWNQEILSYPGAAAGAERCPSSALHLTHSPDIAWYSERVRRGRKFVFCLSARSWGHEFGLLWTL